MKATSRVRTAVMAALIGATCLLSTGTAAHAAPPPPDCGVSNPQDGFEIRHIQNDTATVYVALYYSSSTECVRGEVIAPVNGEIWGDRGSPSNYTGFLGKNKVVAPSQNAWMTGWYKDHGVQARACGTAGAGVGGVYCTSWY